MGKLSCFPGWTRFSCSKKQVSCEATSEAKGLTTKSSVVDSRVWPGDELLSTKSTSTTATDAHVQRVVEAGSGSVSAMSKSGPGFTEVDLEHACSASESFLSSLKHVQEWVNNLESSELSDIDVELEIQSDVSSQAEKQEELNNLVVQYVSPLSGTANLSGIGLNSIPILGAFNSLKSLCISGNSIVRIPPGCLPSSLQVLDLSRNNLSVIEGLRGLNRLRALNLSHNRITRIGHGLGNCTGIRELYLAGNKISEIDGLHRLRKLSLLDLSNNRLTTAKSLLQLAANYNCLQVLNLLGNTVLYNLGEDQIRRVTNTIAPNLTHLNKRPVKAAGVARGASAAGGNHHFRKERRSSGKNKAKRVESMQAHFTKARRRKQI